MFYGNDRTELRRVFYGTWHKLQNGQALEPVETTIARVIQEHPEYHSLLSDPDAGLDRDFPPEVGQTNPFLHMAMHIAIREQVATDRPPGIARLYHEMNTRTDDPLETEHRFMECLGEALWKAQHDGGQPDETAYLACLRRLF